jgi:hypothetical protein
MKNPIKQTNGETKQAKGSSEYATFQTALSKVLQVSHSELATKIKQSKKSRKASSRALSG